MSQLVDEVKARAPGLRGRLVADAAIAEATWFRVGGPAEALFSPADEDDLAYVLSVLPREIPVTTIGLGSNLIVRDGGIKGLVIRLGGRAFGAVEIMEGFRLVAGAATPDQYVAKAAATASVDGLAFLRGVPGSIGGALVMNAGAHGGEVKDALIEARGIDRTGARRVFSNAEMGFAYRHSSGAGRCHFHRRDVSGPPRRSSSDRSRDGAHHPCARSLAADPREDRRLDLQEPAGDEGVGIDRQGGMPGLADRRR